jgi:hypothetical protein
VKGNTMSRIHRAIFLSIAIVAGLLTGCAEKTIQPAAPSKIILTAPPDGAMLYGADTLAVLEWQMTTNSAPTCRVQISHSSNFSNPVVDTLGAGSLMETSFRITGLDTGATYYWRVMANSVSGASEWSDARSFSVPYNNAVINSVNIGGYCTSIAMTAAGDYVYVADSTSAAITVIRTSDNTVNAVIPVVEKCEYVATASNGYVYALAVSNAATYANRGLITVIRQSDNTVIDTLNVPGSMNNFTALAPSPDGAYLYTVQNIERILRVFSTAGFSCIDSVTGLTGVAGVAVSSNGRYVYTSSSSLSGSFIVIDTAGFTIIDSVFAPQVPGQPPRPLGPVAFAAPSAGGASLYIAGDLGTWELNTTNNTITQTFTSVPDIGTMRNAFAASPDNSRLYATLPWRFTMDNSPSDSRLFIIENATQALRGYVSLSFKPTAMVFSSNGTRLFAASTSGKVYVIRALP